MNILVTGANGQLGQEIQLLSRMDIHTYFFTDVCDGYTYLDITNIDSVKKYVCDNNIECIINCAAWTNVDGAEDPDKYELVKNLNTVAPENLAKVMKEVDGLLIHISTDYVFGKEVYNTPCSEDKTGTPTGVYGLTKLLGENRIIATGCKYYIFRTSWLYSEYGKNFVKTMIKLMKEKEKVNVVFDQCGTPTYAFDLAMVILYVITTEKDKSIGKFGIYNFSNEGVCSWYDFARAIKEYANLDCIVRPCTSDQFPSPVKRPAYSVLDKTKIKNTFGIVIPHWTYSLKECINNLK